MELARELWLILCVSFFMDRECADELFVIQVWISSSCLHLYLSYNHVEFQTKRWIRQQSWFYDLFEDILPIYGWPRSGLNGPNFGHNGTRTVNIYVFEIRNRTTRRTLIKIKSKKGLSFENLWAWPPNLDWKRWHTQFLIAISFLSFQRS